MANPEKSNSTEDVAAESLEELRAIHAALDKLYGLLSGLASTSPFLKLARLGKGSS